jgi:hypothetical protein
MAMTAAPDKASAARLRTVRRGVLVTLFLRRDGFSPGGAAARLRICAGI